MVPTWSALSFRALCASAHVTVSGPASPSSGLTLFGKGLQRWQNVFLEVERVYRQVWKCLWPPMVLYDHGFSAGHLSKLNPRGACRVNPAELETLSPQRASPGFSRSLNVPGCFLRDKMSSSHPAVSNQGWRSHQLTQGEERDRQHIRVYGLAELPSHNEPLPLTVLICTRWQYDQRLLTFKKSCVLVPHQWQWDTNVRSPQKTIWDDPITWLWRGDWITE